MAPLQRCTDQRWKTDERSPKIVLLISHLSSLILLLCFTATLAADEIRTDEAVFFFPTCGRFDAEQQSWVVPIHAWLFKQDADSLTARFTLGALRRALDLEPTEEEKPVFARRGGLFVVDNVEKREISVRVGNNFVLLEPSGENGHAFGTVRISSAEANTPGRNGWLRYQADTVDGDERQFVGVAMLLPPRGVSVISDVDDTIKISQVANRRELVSNTFLRTMEPVAGMPQLYRRWAAEGASFHYVTASPWQLFMPIEEFRAESGFPAGTFDMQLFRWKDRTVFNLFTDPDKLKQTAIEALVKEFPERQFVCVGDSGQHDPELYASFARRYPRQIIGVYIRNVTREATDDDRFSRVFSGLPPSLWRLFNDPVELNEVLIAQVKAASGERD
jgi:hypothetical protein